MISILSFIFIISIIVFVHEFGHFIAAKSVGVKVEKFYLGFNFFGLGWSKTYKDTEYGIGLFPLGGYVKVAGMIDESLDISQSYAPDQFRSKNTIQKIWIMSAGVIMNFLLAIFIFSHLAFHNGINEPDKRAIIGKVYPDYPADKLGLKENDKILSINNIKVENWDMMTKEIHLKPNENVNIKWYRNGKILEDTIKTTSVPQLVDDSIVDKGMIGIMPLLHHKDATFFESIKIGLNQTYFYLELIYQNIRALIKGNVSIKDLAGPIMIAKIAGDTAAEGIDALLGLMAFISINLGFFNILPIPGLDGGHIAIAFFEGIIRKELSIKVKLAIQQTGLILLLLLFVIIMFNDIQRIIP